eukprot:scaffold1978_cov381-Prasinococcus_capsulatus_cf.AAC.21
MTVQGCRLSIDALPCSSEIVVGLGDAHVDKHQAATAACAHPFAELHRVTYHHPLGFRHAQRRLDERAGLGGGVLREATGRFEARVKVPRHGWLALAAFPSLLTLLLLRSMTIRNIRCPLCLPLAPTVAAGTASPAVVRRLVCCVRMEQSRMQARMDEERSALALSGHIRDGALAQRRAHAALVIEEEAQVHGLHVLCPVDVLPGRAPRHAHHRARAHRHHLAHQRLLARQHLLAHQVGQLWQSGQRRRRR